MNVVDAACARYSSPMLWRSGRRAVSGNVRVSSRPRVELIEPSSLHEAVARHCRGQDRLSVLALRRL